jgi:hypothetical protein
LKSKIAGILALIVFVFFVTSGLFEGIMNFFVWLVTLNATQSSISAAGEIFVKIASFVVSYTVVGILFNFIGWFNSDAMKLVYFIFSTLVSFALCYVVMILETYLLYIAIGLGVLLLLIIGFIIVLCFKNRDNVN